MGTKSVEGCRYGWKVEQRERKRSDTVQMYRAVGLATESPIRQSLMPRL
jgi:hypothetical protein